MNYLSFLPRKKIAARLVALFFWLFLISFFNFHLTFNLVFLWLGGLLGLILIELDQLLYVFYFHPQQEASQQVKALVAQKRYRRALNWLFQTGPGRKKLSFHNVLFQAIFIPFSFLVLTSSGSLLGAGIVMAIQLSLLLDQINLILKNQDQFFGEKYFWPVSFPVPLRLKKAWVFLMIIAFILLNLLII